VRGRPVLLFATVAIAALLVDLGDLHRLEHADSLVPVLVSLQRFTPFYWDQERFGMLVPLLALPVQGPLANLLVQRGLMVLAGLAAVVLLARHVLAGRDWPLAGALAAGTLLAVAPAPWLFEYLGDQPYGLSLALALAGLAVAEPGADGARRPARLALGLLLVVVAHWVNAAAGLVLLALAAARAVVDLLEGARRREVAVRLGVDAVLLAAGLAAGQLLLRLQPLLTGKPLRLETTTLPPSRWPAAWATFFANAWHDEARWGLALVAAAALGIALLALRPLRRYLPGALGRAGALAAAALGYALFAGSLRWVEANAFHWRYLAPSAVLLHLAAISLLAEPLARLPRLAGRAAGAALALVPAAALAAYGPPSLARVRAGLDEVAGAHTEDVLAAGCDAIAGDYWTVWPAVWHVALVARERGVERAVFGVTHRSNPTLPLWSERPDARICRVRGEEAAAARWLRDYGLGPVREVGRRGTVDVLALAPPGARAATAGTSPRP
jgi:hypothetical protein